MSIPRSCGKIPAGDGWRLGRAVGGLNSNADTGSGIVSRYRKPTQGHHYLHTAIDGHSRLAYSELLGDERNWRRFLKACQYVLTTVGDQGSKVLTDNGSCYRSHTFAEALGEIEHRRTRRGRMARWSDSTPPWPTNGPMPGCTAVTPKRCADFTTWLHIYNYHRSHTALGGQPPATRVTILSGQYT
jgi:transposase InsO family protein